MTNHEKFIEIFGETNGAVKASEAWLNKKYVGPVHMTERENFLGWLQEQAFISYEESGDKIFVKDVDGNPIVRVSDFGTTPGYVYIRIDGLCGTKSIKFVKEAIRKASNECMEKKFGIDSLFSDVFRR